MNRMDPQPTDSLDIALTRAFASIDTAPGFDERLVQKLRSINSASIAPADALVTNRRRLFMAWRQSFHLVLMFIVLMSVVRALWPSLQALIDRALSESLTSGDSTDLTRAVAALFAIVVTAVLCTLSAGSPRGTRREPGRNGALKF
jgi:hypothetical protein